MIARQDVLPRLRSVIAQLPCVGLPPRVLNVGCGSFPSAGELRAALPGWTLYGVDIDGAALCRAYRANGVRLIQADATALPLALQVRFGLVLVRHPDVFRRRAWAEIIPRLPALLAPGGLLLIMVYAPEEVRLIRSLPLLPDYPLDEDNLAAADLVGRDRFVLAFGPAD